MKLKPFFWPKILDNAVSCVDYGCCKIRGAPPSLTFPLLSLFYPYPRCTPAFLSSFVWFMLTYDISWQLYHSVHRYWGQGAAWHCRKRFNAPHPQRLVYRRVGKLSNVCFSFPPSFIYFHCLSYLSSLPLSRQPFSIRSHFS